MFADSRFTSTILPELLTAKQTAELLSISIRTVWELARQNKLRPIRIRRCTRWRRSDVIQFVDGLGNSNFPEVPAYE